ncbi:unnamed protein product, partial [marine sediment metagenome]
RRAKNIISSPGLLARMDWTAANMKANCGLADKCVPTGMTDMAIGQPVPGAVGKRYVACTTEEIKSEGKSGITYSDVVRWLAVKAGIREGTM